MRTSTAGSRRRRWTRHGRRRGRPARTSRSRRGRVRRPRRACKAATATQSAAGRCARARRSSGAITCFEGLSCVMSVCERPSAADAGAKPAAKADAGAAPGVRPRRAADSRGRRGPFQAPRMGQVDPLRGRTTRAVFGIGGSSTGPQSCNAVDVGCSPAPVAVTGLSAPVDSVAAAGAETCAVLAGGAVACWGFNCDLGQLGSLESPPGPETSQASKPAPQLRAARCPVWNWRRTAAVATNGSEACAAPARERRRGMLGQQCHRAELRLRHPAATQTCASQQRTAMHHHFPRESPQPLRRDCHCGEVGFATVRPPSDGTVQCCWAGMPTVARFGVDGTTTDSSTPVVVSGVSGASAIAMAESSACALVSNGDVVC